jgi:hypothetical protein
VVAGFFGIFIVPGIYTPQRITLEAVEKMKEKNCQTRLLRGGRGAPPSRHLLCRHGWLGWLVPTHEFEPAGIAASSKGPYNCSVSLLTYIWAYNINCKPSSEYVLRKKGMRRIKECARIPNNYYCSAACTCLKWWRKKPKK